MGLGFIGGNEILKTEGNFRSRQRISPRKYTLRCTHTSDPRHLGIEWPFRSFQLFSRSRGSSNISIFHTIPYCSILLMTKC